MTQERRTDHELRCREVLREYADGVYGNSHRPAQLIAWLVLNGGDNHYSMEWFITALWKGLDMDTTSEFGVPTKPS